MRYALWQRNPLKRTSTLTILVGMTMVIAACGTATPTRPPASPTLVVSVQPTSAEPTIPPTATGPAGAPTPSPTPIGGTPSAPITSTVAATNTVAAVATRTPRPTSPPPPPPKPVALSGKIAYSVYLGADYKLLTIQVATVNSTAGAQILTRASWPAFSPDGARIAYFHWADGLYIANADGGGAIGPLYISPGVCCINWSRDGTWIVFADSPRANKPGGPIKMLKVDGAYKTIVDLNVDGNGLSFSPDGKQIAFSGCLPNTNTCGLIVSPTDGSGATRLLTRDNGGNAQWSPDGKKIVYQATDDAGHLQVFVINVDGSAARKQLTQGKSNDGQPAWSRDGGSVFWRSDQNGTAWAIYVMNADGSNPRRLISEAPANPNLWGWESISVAP